MSGLSSGEKYKVSRENELTIGVKGHILKLSQIDICLAKSVFWVNETK